MNEEQFNDLMKQLVQIEFNTRKEIPPTVSIESTIAAIRDAFYHQLEAKIGWGRIEVTRVFEAAVESATE